MKESLRVLALYPVLVGAASGALALLLRGWSHGNLCSLIAALAAIHLVWLPRSLLPFLRRRQHRT